MVAISSKRAALRAGGDDSGLDPRSPTPRAHPRDAYVLLSLCLGGLLVRGWFAVNESLWGDELYTRLLLGQPLMKMLRGIPATEATPGLFYVLNWLSTRVAGTTDLGLRLLSVASGVAVIPCIYLLGRWLAGRRCGLFAAVLCSVHPLLIWYSADARSYSTLVLLTTAGWITFARLVEQPQLDRLFAWVITACLTLAMHYFGSFVIAGQFLWLLVTQRSLRKHLVLSTMLMAAVGAAAAPTWAAQVPDRGVNPFSVIPLAHRLGDAVGMTVVGVSAPTWPLAVPGLILGVVAGAFLVWTKGSSATLRAKHLLGAAAVGLSLALVVGRDFFIGRNLIGAWPVLIVVFSAAVVLAPRRAGLILGVGFLAVTMTAAAALLTDRRLQRPDWGHAAAVVGAKRPDLAVVVVGGFYAGAMTAYLDSPAIGDTEAREVVAIGSTAPEGRRGCYNGPMCSVTPAEPVERPLPGLQLVERRKTGLWRIAIYRSNAPVRVDTSNAARFFTAPRPFRPPVIYAPRP